MKIAIQFEKDSEADSCNWQEVERNVLKWTNTFADFQHPVDLSGKKEHVLKIDIETNNFLQAIQKLHLLLYDHQVNFIVVPEDPSKS